MELRKAQFRCGSARDRTLTTGRTIQPPSRPVIRRGAHPQPLTNRPQMHKGPDSESRGLQGIKFRRKIARVGTGHLEEENRRTNSPFGQSGVGLNKTDGWRRKLVVIE
jgi:hypothetical protein